MPDRMPEEPERMREDMPDSLLERISEYMPAEDMPARVPV